MLDKPEITISAVTKEDLGEVWPIVSPMLDKAIVRTHGRWHNVDVMMEILQGKASLWIAFNAQREIIGSLVLTISNYPGGILAGRVDYIGGRDREAWFDPLWDTIVRYCKAEGCDMIEGICRKGMIRYVIDRYGCKETGTFFELDLRDDDGR